MAPPSWQRSSTCCAWRCSRRGCRWPRIDDAVTRILTKKFELGLFERPCADRSYLSTFGSPSHRALAREAVQKSQVLLKNDGVLPLPRRCPDLRRRQERGRHRPPERRLDHQLARRQR